MTLTYRRVVGRALAAGVVAGILVAAYQLAVVEPVIDDAVALEEQIADHHAADRAAEHAADHAGGVDGDHDEELFTRREQVGGGVAGSLVYAVVVAAVFGTVYAALRHRLPGVDELHRSAWLAGSGFLAVALVPSLVHPPNPPAVGDPDTVDQRTFQYLSLIVVGIIAVRLLTALSAALRSRFDDPTRQVTVAAAAVVGFGLIVALYPATSVEIDPAVPAGLVWDFRIRSIGGLALMWTALGLAFGWLLERDVRAAAPDTTPSAVPA